MDQNTNDLLFYLTDFINVIKGREGLENLTFINLNVFIRTVMRFDGVTVVSVKD